MRSLRQSASSLNKNIKVASQPRKNMNGSEIGIGSFLSKPPKLTAITYELDNTADADNAKVFIIGDPTGMIREVKGGTIALPDKVQGKAGLVAPHLAFLQTNAIKYNRINYKTSSDTNQFSESFEHVTVNVGGVSNTTPIPMGIAETNTQQNPHLQTIKGEFDVDVNSGFLVTVLAGEKVTLVCTPALYM